MNAYIYKHEGNTFMCCDFIQEDQKKLFIEKMPMIGNHCVTARIVNGDDFEDGEEITDEGYLVYSAAEVDKLFAFAGIAPPIRLVRV